jgi:HEAT repeat protein
MKAIKTGLILALLSSTAWAQVGGLMNADISERTSISDPAQAVRVTNRQWVAFSMPALEGTQSPCCWKGSWNRFTEVGCSLDKQHQSYGTRFDSPLAENLIAYAEVSDGEVISLRVVGEHCPVEGDGAKVTWMGNADDTAGLNWLEALARSDKHDSVDDSALYAIALHRSNDAGQRLYAMAKEANGELSGEAIFWLGDARGADGFDALKSLLAELPKGDSRREINFALAQNGTPAAIDLLAEISRSDSDPEQRGSALFWLAEEFPEQAPDLLLDAIDREQSEEVLEQAVFAISQLPSDTGTQMLLELARDKQQPREVRRQALFWLANSDDDNAVAALADLLTR